MRTTNRNFSIAAFAVMALLMLGACTGESPTQPPITAPITPTPTPGQSGGTSIALSISNAEPLVQSTSTITATVTINGQPAPNGTAVEFETTLGTFADTGGTISLRTTTNGVATVVLSSASPGTAQVTARLPGAENIRAEGTVIFRAQPPGPTPIVTSITSISPTRGGPAGGQEVIIRGQNFRAPVRVLFGDKLAAAQLISSTEIRAIAPATNLGPSNQFEEVDVVVISEAGTPVEQRATSPQKFRYELTILQPAITTLAPSSGPNEGRTRVTIFGEGFSAPMRVFFGTGGAAGAPLIDEVEADVVSAPTFNQIVVMTPPALGLGAPLANQQVTVRVLNVLTGRDAVLVNAFRYGPGMRITAAGPTTLSATGGDRVTIDGWGFDDPVAVSLAGVAADPIFVSGTRIVVISGRPIGCVVATGPVRVTNIEDGNTAEGPDFTYLQPVVAIIGVSPTTAAPGSSVTLTVQGVTGSGSPRVTIGSSTVIATRTGLVNGVGTFTFNIPEGLTFNTEACTAGGTRPVPTQFSIGFEEVGSGCPSDSLSNALTVTPPQTGVLRLQPTSLTFNATVGSTSTNSFQIINNGAGNLTVNSVSDPGAPFSHSSPGSVTLAPCESVTVNVTYAPTTAGTTSRTINVNTSAGTASVALTGTATAPAPPAP
jgi:hypothetical protein